MPNVLTALQATLFASARDVPTELTGFLPAIDRDFNDQGVNKGGTVKVTSVPAMTAAAPGAAAMTFTAGADRTPTTLDFTLNQEAQVTWNLTAEDERLLLISGNAQETLLQTLKQGWRALRNQIEAHVALQAKLNASRSIGTSGTTPFAANADLLVDARKLMNQNGADTNRTFIMDLDASANYGKLSTLTKVNEAGSDELLRNGLLGRIQSFDIRESAGVVLHTKGTMTTALVNSAVLAIGSTTITFDTGTPGATGIVAGDVVSFAGDTNKYVVKTASPVAAAGTFVLQEPGLLVAVADNAAITVENGYRANIALARSAMKVVARPMLQPEGPIAEQMIISDPVTKLSCNLLRVVGDRMTSWYMRITHDAFAPNPYGIHIIRG